MRSLVLSAAVVSTVAAFGLALAPAAGATPSPSPSPSDSPSASSSGVGQTPQGEQHCVIRPSTSKRPVNATCYRTFAEAVADVTGGRVTDAPDPATMTSADRADLDRRIDAANRANKQVSAQADEYPIRVATAWEHENYQGSSMMFASKQGCYGNYNVYKYAELAYGWNDRISSIQTFEGCRGLLYEHTYFGGSYTQRFDKLGKLKGMNDRASSAQIGWMPNE
ncbi:hypothetical protein [Streptosporangium carneum]|uniref:Uncharacterized protein n=1 Tax=Streptosporangium carneum TaxID=47481 RepID=A0A9W6I465_9ACTN|nr:hypothetical protein [Streptosporangium carneum]GLK11091.1 hypothetical protein GCM10017600_44970 [Streptosporangium carneum]